MKATIDLSALKKLEENLKNIEGTQRVSLPELFNPHFMQKHTNYDTIEGMFEASGYEVNSKEDFQAIPDAEWDEFIKKSTQFSSWQEMQQVGAKEYFVKKLGFGN